MQNSVPKEWRYLDFCRNSVSHFDFPSGLLFRVGVLQRRFSVGWGECIAASISYLLMLTVTENLIRFSDCNCC